MTNAKTGLNEQAAFGYKVGCCLFCTECAYALNMKYADNIARNMLNSIDNVEVIICEKNDELMRQYVVIAERK